MFVRSVLLSGLVLMAVATPSSAQDSACRALKDDKARLECFDRAAKPDAPDEATATTKEVVAAFGASDYKVVDPSDLYVAPTKYTGKPVQVRNVQCLHADKDEFRCIAPGASILLVMAADITPSAARTALEDTCGTMRAMPTAACRRTIRFVPLMNAGDVVNGRNRVVIATPSAEVVAGEEPRRRRR